MIDYIKGVVAELTPTDVVVENNGIGYVMAISLNTYSAIQGQRDVKLFVTEVIREDAHILFGFATKRERECFGLLTSVSGIGGQIARTILSAYSAVELSNIVSSGDAAALKRVKGIGPKAAQRIIIDLKDSMAELAGFEGQNKAAAIVVNEATATIGKEAVAALGMLGFAPSQTQKVVSKILGDFPNAPVEEVIKRALKML